jgi:hypothetical protein
MMLLRFGILRKSYYILGYMGFKLTITHGFSRYKVKSV